MYSASAMTVEPSSNSTSEPNSPRQVGATPVVSSVWHDKQPTSAASSSPLVASSPPAPLPPQATTTARSATIHLVVSVGIAFSHRLGHCDHGNLERDGPRILE